MSRAATRLCQPVQRRVADRDRYWAIMADHFIPGLDVAAPVNAELQVQSITIDAEEEEPQMQVIDGVAVIDVVGVLRKTATLYERLFGGGTTYAQITRQVQFAAANGSVNVIMLRIDSPGGTVAGGSDTVDALLDARARKPIIAFISDLGASAAYRLASQATHIYGDRDALVGSIGTYTVIPDYSGMMEKHGVKVHVVKAGKHKGAGSFGTELTDEQIADFQREIDQLNDVFISEIVRGRGWSESKVRELADGRAHVGEHAKQIGLIDDVMTMDQAFEAARRMGNESSSTFQELRSAVRSAVRHQSAAARGGKGVKP